MFVSRPPCTYLIAAIRFCLDMLFLSSDKIRSVVVDLIVAFALIFEVARLALLRSSNLAFIVVSLSFCSWQIFCQVTLLCVFITREVLGGGTRNAATATAHRITDFVVFNEFVVAFGSTCHYQFEMDDTGNSDGGLRSV